MKLINFMLSTVHYQHIFGGKNTVGHISFEARFLAFRIGVENLFFGVRTVCLSVLQRCTSRETTVTFLIICWSLNL